MELGEKQIAEVLQSFEGVESLNDLMPMMDKAEFEKLWKIEHAMRFVSQWRHPYTLSVEFPNGWHSDAAAYSIPITCRIVVTAISSDLKKSLVRIVRKHGCSIVVNDVPAEALEKWKWAYVIDGGGDQLVCQVIYRDGESGGRLDFQVYINGISG